MTCKKRLIINFIYRGFLLASQLIWEKNSSIVSRRWLHKLKSYEDQNQNPLKIAKTMS